VTYHLRAVLARIRELFRGRSRIAAEQQEEFALHIEMETAENVRRGMTEADARRAALVRFGGAQRYHEETTDARGVVSLDNLARDARFAIRRLRRAPGFSAAVIATLGIGLGVAVGIGSIVYGVLLRDLPYDRPDQLVRVGFITNGAGPGDDVHSSTTYFHFAKSSRSFSALSEYFISEDYNLTDGDTPERVTVASISPNTLTMLGARPILGSLLEQGDTSYSNPRSAILISERLWRRRYGADSSIIGRRIDINRGSRRVVGILPRSFAYPAPSVDIFYPATVPVNQPQISARGYVVVGRLRDGVTPAMAAAELNALLPRISDRFPTITREMLERSGARMSVTPLKAATVAPVRPQLILLGVLVAVVLLIATTNVVNLFLLRTERGSQETAIALSLGASRLALLQRFVIEGMVLGLASTVVALPAAALALSTKFGFTEREIPRLHEVSFTPSTIALVVAGAVVLGAAMGLIGLTRTGLSGLFDRLRAARSTPSRGWRRAQDVLVAFQVAIALVLLVAAGLLSRSFWNLHEAKIGFEPGHAMTFDVSLPWGEDGYVSYAKSASFHARFVDRITALPGVTSVAIALRIPLAGHGRRYTFDLQSGDDQSRGSVQAPGNCVTANYFGAMGIPLRAGRTFRSGDLRGAPAVILSERLAIRIFGTADVVGRIVNALVQNEPPRSFTVVGIVGDVRSERIEDGELPMLYFPLQRDIDGLPEEARPVPVRPMDVQYVVRGAQLPSPVTLQNVLKEMDHRVPATSISSYDALMANATARVRLTMLLIAVAGVSAMLLAVVGVYSVVAYAASGRTREFGIRLALGAAPGRIGGMVFGDGFKLVTLGTATGLAAAFGATRFLRALLYEVEPTSAVEFSLASALLIVVTVVATLVPARRAARTPPATVLRGE
jgi:predicted permease